ETGARTTACPNRSVVGPSGETQGVAPHSDAGEEMALREASEVFGLDFLDRAFINFPIGNHLRFDEFAQPCRRKGVILVVVGTHGTSKVGGRQSSTSPQA